MSDSKINHAVIYCLILVSLFWILASCASISPPGGGPVDEIAPEVVMTQPEPGATNVDPGVKIRITFSELVDRVSFADALFISPPPVDKPQIKWHGATAEIRLPDPILPDQTVLFTIGAGLTDLHRVNLEDSYSFAISAGDRLIDGKIKGVLFSQDRVQGMLVGAWLVENDSLIDPSVSSPQYVTQAGQDNQFMFRYLPPGLFRIFAWEDKDHDRLYNPGSDKLGIPWKDVHLGVEGTAWMDIFPSKQDTARARPLYVSATDRNHAIIRFSKMPEIHPDSLVLQINIAADEYALPITGAWFDAADSSRLIIYTGEQDFEREYTVSFTADTTSLQFSGTDIPDTTAPKIISSFPGTGMRDLPNLPEGWFAFSDAVEETVWDSLIILTSGDSIEIPLKFNHKKPYFLTWRALERIEAGTRCRLSVDMQGVSDLNKNISTDTLHVISFTVKDPAELGTFSGTVYGSPPPVFVVAQPVRGRKNKSYTNKAGQDGTFKIENVPPDEYILWAYSDINDNGIFDTGSFKPFRYSERFAAVADTLQVRERWETSGVEIYFR